MANGFKIKLDTILIDPERNFHGVVKERAERLDGRGKMERLYGVCTPTHDGGKTPLYWYREGRVQLVDGTFAVVYPKAIKAIAAYTEPLRASDERHVEYLPGYEPTREAA